MDNSKQCFRCLAVKPLTEFYKHSQMADGHLNKCKDCTKSEATKNRWENIDRFREYDRARGKEPHRIENTTKQTKAWRDKDSRRNKAHLKVSRALKSGVLQRQSCCRCQDLKTIAHHEDYDFPLDVIWLCQPCHKQRHKEMAQEQSVKEPKKAQEN